MLCSFDLGWGGLVGYESRITGIFVPWTHEYDSLHS